MSREPAAPVDDNEPRSSPLPAARRRGVFWGWWIVVGAVVAQFAAMGAGGGIAGVFLRPMTEDLGWTAAEYTLGGSSAFLLGGVAGFLIGPFVDRYGARPLMLAGACIYAAAFLAMSRVEELWQFVALSMIAGGAGLSMVGPLVVNATLSKWFVVRRGWAIALGSSGISFAGLIMPLTMTRIVDSAGWRDAYAILAVVVFAIVVPVALVMRRQPEDYGLLPDGLEPGATADIDRLAAEAQARDAANSYTRGEALRTPAIWLLVVGYGLNILALSAVLVHAIPFMTDNGFTRAEAALALAVNGGANLSSKFVWGYCLQRVHARYLSATALSISATGVVTMLVAAQAGRAAADVPRVLPLGLRVRRDGAAERVHLGEVLRARAHRGRARRRGAVHDRLRGAGADPRRAVLRRGRFVRRRLRGVCRRLPRRRPRDPRLTRAAAEAAARRGSGLGPGRSFATAASSTGFTR